MTLGTGAQIAGHSISQIFSSPEFKEKKWNALLLKQSQKLTEELGLLKGSLMKAGQLLAVYGEYFFPPEANQFLKSLQSDSPAVAWPEIERILKSELGENYKLLIIQTESIGSASLGQVHPAEIVSTKNKIAVKVQYPGVSQAIRSDLKAIKTILKLLQLLPADLDMDSLFVEIQSMLEQELNYSTEADYTEKYSQLLQNDNRYRVPKIYRDFSTQQILTTSLESGVRADSPQVLNRSQEDRNLLAENFLDLYFKEIFEWGLVQTDPHLGNYLIDGNQIVLLDFGACRQYDEKFLSSYRKMIKYAILQDAKNLRKVAKELKFIDDSDNADIQILFEKFCLMIVEPFLDKSGVYDWNGTDLPKRATQVLMEIIKKFHLKTPPKEILFLDRKMGGVFIFLSVLKAKINGAKIIAPYLSRV